MKVRFNLRRNKASNPQILLIVRLKAYPSPIKIGTGLHVPENYWNLKKMRVRENVAFPDYVKYNLALDSWENAVKTVNNKYLTGKLPSKLQFIEEVNNEMQGSSKRDQKSFIAYYEDFIKLKKIGRVKPRTVDQYQNALNKVLEFMNKILRVKDVNFDELTESFFLKFIEFLERDVQNNTVHKVLKRLRTVLKHAEENGIQVPQAYKSRSCKVSYIKQPKIYLSEPEIQQIRELEIDPGSRLDKVRDRMLIGLNTGLRYSDFSRLNQDHVKLDTKGRQIIEILTTKDGKVVPIPLTSEVKSILGKYNGFPPSISEQKFNNYVKELCRLAGITEKITRIQNGVQVTYEKWELVSSHICRRSFATKFYKKVPIRLLMLITGHTTEAMFRNYICTTEEEALDELLSHPAFQN